MQAIQVKGVVSHYAMHNDELLALWFAIVFGEKCFPGIATAPLQLVDSGTRLLQGKTGAQWFAEGYPCLGTCGGPLDEHDLPPAERANTSAATLMAERLGIAGHSPVRAMLEHAVRVDRTATAAGFDVSALIKAWHRNNVPTHQVRRMFDRAAAARSRALSGRVRNINWKTRPDLSRLAAEWLIERTAPGGYNGGTSFATAYEAAEHLGVYGWGSLGPILEYLRDGKHNSNDFFSLFGTVAAMNMGGFSVGHIREFVFTSLDAKLVEQVSFLKGYDQLLGLKSAGRLYIGGSPLRIMRVSSDSTEINRSARMLDKHYDVFIQRQSDGHMVIWYNKNKLNMDAVAARLRMNDRNAHHLQRLPWDRLTAEGTLPEAPWWYYNPANGQIMNGSLTNRGTPVTKLDDNAVIQCIVHGLEAVGRGQ